MRRCSTIALVFGLVIATSLGSYANSRPGPCYSSVSIVSTSGSPGTHCNPPCVSPRTCFDFSYDFVFFCDVPKTLDCPYCVQAIARYYDGTTVQPQDRQEGTVLCGKYKVLYESFSDCGSPGSGSIVYSVWDSSCTSVNNLGGNLLVFEEDFF